MFQKQEATKRNEEMSEQKEHSVILQSFLLNLFCSDLQEGGERMKGGGKRRKSIYTRWCKLALCSILGKVYENPERSGFHMKLPQI